MSIESTVYCDESGNDGPNYLNREQPFYVLAGWITPNDSILDATLKVEELRRKCAPQATEVKSRVLKKWLDYVVNLFDSFDRIGIVPLFVVAEKRFCIAAKIVETFLDPMYNPNIKIGLTSDLLTKREIANDLYEHLPQELLESFANVYRNPTADGYEAVLSEVMASCKEVVNPELAEIMAGASGCLADLAKDEVEAVEEWGKGMGTLNFPCLIAFLMHLEDYCSRNEMKCKVVHDQHDAYEKDYLKAYEMCHGSSAKPILLEGMRSPIGPVNSLSGFETQASDKQPMVQAADLLAGSIALLAKKLSSEVELDQSESELARTLLPLCFAGDPALTLLVCSESVNSRLRQAVFDIVPEVRHDVDNSIPGITALSTQPNSFALPLLPALSQQGKAEEQGATVKLDLPIYGIVDEGEGRLAVMVPNDVEIGTAMSDERTAMLWLSSGPAEEFFNETDWSVPQVLKEFGPSELMQLVEKMIAVQEWTDWVVVSDQDGEPHLMPIAGVIEGMLRIINRLRRLVGSGVLHTVMRMHDVGGQEAYTILLSSGEYAASVAGGVLVLGASREEALESLQKTLEG